MKLEPKLKSRQFHPPKLLYFLRNQIHQRLDLTQTPTRRRGVKPDITIRDKTRIIPATTAGIFILRGLQSGGETRRLNGKLARKKGKKKIRKVISCLYLPYGYSQEIRNRVLYWIVEPLPTSSTTSNSSTRFSWNNWMSSKRASKELLCQLKVEVLSSSSGVLIQSDLKTVFTFQAL